MTPKSFITSWKGHCDCPTPPLTSTGVGRSREITDDKRIHLTRFVLYVCLFFPHLLGGGHMKRGNCKQMWLLSICCSQVLACYDFKGHECFEVMPEVRHLFLFFSFHDHCLTQWYLTSCRVTALNLTISLGQKSLISGDTAVGWT